MFKYFESLIDPYCDYPRRDHPPQRLAAFLWEYAQPFKRIFAVATLLSILGGFLGRGQAGGGDQPLHHLNKKAGQRQVRGGRVVLARGARYGRRCRARR